MRLLLGALVNQVAPDESVDWIPMSARIPGVKTLLPDVCFIRRRLESWIVTKNPFLRPGGSKPLVLQVITKGQKPPLLPILPHFPVGAVVYMRLAPDTK